MSIGIAILGAGLFGKDEYLPAIQESSLFTLKAVYSRSQNSAQQFAAAASIDSFYYDTPADPEHSLQVLLARKDIGAVVLALPILVQPDLIQAALRAGKHVLSEKPIAKDSVVGKELISAYGPYKSLGLVWSVAENFRFIDPIKYGVEQLRRLGGEVTSFQISVHDQIKDGNPFFATEWRKKPDYQGGFVLDGGVHFLAGLREFLTALGDSITTVISFSTQMTSYLPPVDTLNGAILLASGRSGVVQISFGTEFKSDFLIEVVSSNGSVAMTPAGVKVSEKNADGELKEDTKPFPFNTGVTLELEAFGNAIMQGVADKRQTAEEALLDLQLVEALLRSGESNGTPVAV